MRKVRWCSALLLILILLASSLMACAKPAPAQFEVMSLDVAPPQANAGESVTVTAQVKNVGGSEGVYAAILSVDGAEVETKVITLAPGETETVIFPLIKDRAGAYKVTVGAVSSDLIIKEKPLTLEQLNISYPQLYQELLKLPDLKEIDERDAKALESIIRLALDTRNKPAFESMLSEGIEDKRKYCTPLEALLWIAYDRDFKEYNPLSNYSLPELMNNAWENTTTSNDYTSERWQDFEEVVDRVSSPRLIEIYMANNYTYEYSTGEAEGVKSAERVFRDKKGACYDHAVLAGYCLKKNGYDTAQGIALNFDRVVEINRIYLMGHVLCVYQDPEDSAYYAIDDIRVIRLWGPYKTIKDAAEEACNRATFEKAKLKRYSLHDIDLRTGKCKTTWSLQ